MMKLLKRVKVRVSGDGVAWVKSEDIINSIQGQRQLKAVKKLKAR